MNKSMAFSDPDFLAVLLLMMIFSAWSSAAEFPGGVESLPCIAELLPCQPYLKDPSSPPPNCCQALLRVVAAETQCLCQVFTNQALLQAANVTKEDALNLAKSCGSTADQSICGPAASPSGSHPTPGPATPSNFAKSPVASPPAKNAAAMMQHVGGSVWVAAATIAWAF